MALSGPTRARLTKAQERILAYVRARVRDDGMPPTHDEIRREFGLQSTYGVRQHLRLIKNKGYLDLYPGKSRGIRLHTLSAGLDRNVITEIPVIGRIAAGQPILAEEHWEGHIAVSEDLFPSGVLFALRVQGESMIRVGINAGDLAVIRQQATVENGQIAAVQRGDEATLKRVYAYADHVRLKAENDDVPDIRIDKSMGVAVRILGLYVGLIRQGRQ